MALIKHASQLVGRPVPVLIEGETSVGKGCWRARSTTMPLDLQPVLLRALEEGVV